MTSKSKDFDSKAFVAAIKFPAKTFLTIDPAGGYLTIGGDGDLTPLYELVVEMLTRGTHTTWMWNDCIQHDGWMMVSFPALQLFGLSHAEMPLTVIRMDSQLGRAILAAW